MLELLIASWAQKCKSRSLEQMNVLLTDTCKSLIRCNEKPLFPTHGGSSSSTSISTSTSIPPFAKFVALLTKKSQTHVIILLAALVYLNRLRSKLPPAAKGLYCTHHRILLASVITASKYLNDSPPRNKQWAKLVSIFSLSEINLMEKQFLQLLDFDLRVREKDLAELVNMHWFVSPAKGVLDLKTDNAHNSINMDCAGKVPQITIRCPNEEKHEPPISPRSLYVSPSVSDPPNLPYIHTALSTSNLSLSSLSSSTSRKSSVSSLASDRESGSNRFTVCSLSPTSLSGASSPGLRDEVPVEELFNTGLLQYPQQQQHLEEHYVTTAAAAMLLLKKHPKIIHMQENFEELSQGY